MPTTSDIKAVGKEEFSTWKVECNGHYYDFNEKAYKTNATNKSCSNVNSGAFDETMLNNFLSDTNVSYVLLRPGNTTEKPHLTVTLDMSGDSKVYIKQTYASNGRFVGLAIDSNCLYGTVAGSETTIQDENGTNVYSKLSLSVIYDIEYSDLYAILPNADYLTKDITEMTWQFTISDNSGEDSYDFNETNWNAHRPARPADPENPTEVTFKLVSKS